MSHRFLTSVAPWLPACDDQSPVLYLAAPAHHETRSSRRRTKENSPQSHRATEQTVVDGDAVDKDRAHVAILCQQFSVSSASSVSSAVIFFVCLRALRDFVVSCRG